MSWQDNRIQAAINGTNPMLMKELKGGYLVFWGCPIFTWLLRIVTKTRSRFS